MAWKLKKGDDVFVVAGDHKGSKGKISLVDRKKNRVIVEGVNIVSRHVKPSMQNPEGGVVKKRGLYSYIQRCFGCSKCDRVVGMVQKNDDQDWLSL